MLCRIVFFIFFSLNKYMTLHYKSELPADIISEFASIIALLYRIEPYPLDSESSRKRIREFFFWYLLLKSSTKIWSSNIRRYLRENSNTRKTGSLNITMQLETQKDCVIYWSSHFIIFVCIYCNTQFCIMSFQNSMYKID